MTDLLAPLPPRHTTKKPPSTSKGSHSGQTFKRQVSRQLRHLTAFFDEPLPFDIMRGIVKERTGAVSLRMLEFVCTTLARQGLVVEGPTGERVNVDAVYQDALRANGKVFFDAFRRNKEGLVRLRKHGESMLTTVGQMRFFRLVIEKGIYQYTLDHTDEIAAAMNRHAANPAPRAHPGARHNPRRPLVLAGETTLVFDPPMQPAANMSADDA